MAGARSSQALTVRGQNSSGFVQQGSLDWVGLGQMQYNATLAVLGRLSKAGIEVFTEAFGKALGGIMPIGLDGEKVITDTVRAMTAKSFAEDILWIGVGVRHILHDFVLSREGCSLVALCSALSEAHDMSVAALVIYQIAEECGAPADMMPSYRQWESLVRVTSPVLSKTRFSERVQMILKLGTKSNHRISSENSHPTDLAKVLLDIGQVAKGILQGITVHGGLQCSWIAVWADYIVGLRTLVLDVDGNPVYANYNMHANAIAQVTVQFIESNNGPDIRTLSVGKIHILRSGIEFIRQSFSRVDHLHPDDSELRFSAGRLPRAHMLQDTFGNSFLYLIGKEPEGEEAITSTTPTGSPPEHIRELSTAVPESFPLKRNAEQVCELFMEIVAIAAVIFALKEVVENQISRAENYVFNACKNIPELSQCRDSILTAVRAVHRKMKIMSLQSMYSKTRFELCKYCDCETCHPSVTPGRTCLALLAETVVYLSFVLDRLVLDTQLLPNAWSLYTMADHNQSRVKHINIERSGLQELYLALTRKQSGVDKLVPFHVYARLFAGQNWSGEPQDCSAQSDGKLYCYINTLEELTDRLDKASLVHVGSGTIQFRGKLYCNIYDSLTSSKQRLGPASGPEEIQDFSSLQTNSISHQISTQVVVEARLEDLFVWHLLRAGVASVHVAPTKVLYRLIDSLDYLLKAEHNPDETKKPQASKLKDHFRLLRGECEAIDGKYHILRPLRGNALGRCMIMSCATEPLAFVRSEAELESFARFWANLRASYMANGKEAPWYTLIS